MGEAAHKWIWDVSKKTNKQKQRSGKQQWLWTGKYCNVEGAKALASMLLMNVPLVTLDLSGETITLLDMILKEHKMVRLMIVMSSQLHW